MKYIKKRLVLGLLMVLTSNIFALNPPIIQCIKPFLLGSVPCLHIDWESNTDCMHFKAYYIYVNGVLRDSATTFSDGILYYTGGKDIRNVPTASQYYCYIVAVDSFDNSCQSNTLYSINMNAQANATRTATNLVWNAPTTTFGSTWGNKFYLYKKHGFETNFPTDPFDSVPISQLSYTDPSDVCDDTLSYQVGINHFFYDIGGNLMPCSFKTNIDTVQHMTDNTNPIAPVLDSVSVVHSSTGDSVRLGFHTTEPYMQAFVIYRECPPPSPWPPYDTVYDIGNGYATWTDTTVNPNNVSFNYRIAAMDSCGNIGPMINDIQHNIILYQDGFNSCYRSDDIHWTSYQNLIDGIDHYEIMLSSDNGATWQNIGNTTTNNYVINNLQTNQDYEVYVRVVNNGGTITASTNRIQFNIPPATANDFSYIRSVSVIDDMYVQIKVLTSGDTLPFKTLTLQRSENGTDFEDFMTFNYQPSANYEFSDTLANFDQKTYYYRTFIINNCDDTVYSNISHNILLEGENNAQANHLIWSSYDNWDGGVSEYYVLRKEENEPMFNTITDVEPRFFNEYSDNISSLFESGSKFVYYIKATENTNRYGFNETSYSNHITVIQPPTVYLSNAFRPMSSGDNSVFRPINSFVSPDQYRFSIYTRTGECIFITTNPQDGWDGKKNGVIVPMDVYIYYIEYKMPDGTITKQPGTVTVIK